MKYEERQAMGDRTQGGNEGESKQVLSSQRAQDLTQGKGDASFSTKVRQEGGTV